MWEAIAQTNDQLSQEGLIDNIVSGFKRIFAPLGFARDIFKEDPTMIQIIDLVKTANSWKTLVGSFQDVYEIFDTPLVSHFTHYNEYVDAFGHRHTTTYVIPNYASDLTNLLKTKPSVVGFNESDAHDIKHMHFNVYDAVSNPAHLNLDVFNSSSHITGLVRENDTIIYRKHTYHKHRIVPALQPNFMDGYIAAYIDPSNELDFRKMVRLDNIDTLIKHLAIGYKENRITISDAKAILSCFIDTDLHLMFAAYTMAKPICEAIGEFYTTYYKNQTIRNYIPFARGAAESHIDTYREVFRTSNPIISNELKQILTILNIRPNLG